MRDNKIGSNVMRIWDVPVRHLCRKHLLGEHVELHAIWVILTQDKRGYRSHPEVKRWEGKLKALYNRHAEQVKEMLSRGYNHRSPLNYELSLDSRYVQDKFVNTIDEQYQILGSKPCSCFPHPVGCECNCHHYDV